MVVFSEDGTWKLPSDLQPGGKSLVLVTHDESTFNANDGKHRIWIEGKKKEEEEKNLLNMVASLGQQMEYLARVAKQTESNEIPANRPPRP